MKGDTGSRLSLAHPRVLPAARRLIGALAATCGIAEPRQGPLHIGQKDRKLSIHGGGARNDDVIAVWAGKIAGVRGQSRLEAATDAIASDRVAKFFRDGEAEAGA